ncbi:hypothetical protein FOFC_18810 [Fusarium oxysporum]|nr:hypothetical protein FOFC_18810 [Fusarium oxysporum]
MARKAAAASAHSSVHQGAGQASSSSSSGVESVRGIPVAPSSTISTNRLSSSSVVTRILPGCTGVDLTSGKVRLSVKWSELVARWSSTIASASGRLVKARSIVLPYGFVGISKVLRRLRSFSDAHPAISWPLFVVWPSAG